VPAKKELIDELNFLTDVLSDRMRWLAGWVLGLSWLVIIQGTDAPSFLERHDIIAPIVLALLALLIDFSRYCFGYKLNLRLINSFPCETETIRYDGGTLLYRLRRFAFYAKIAVTVVAASRLVIVLAIRFVHMLRGSTDCAGA
jgi:hypothetical protein